MPYNCSTFRRGTATFGDSQASVTFRILKMRQLLREAPGIVAQLVAAVAPVHATEDGATALRDLAVDMRGLRPEHEQAVTETLTYQRRALLHAITEIQGFEIEPGQELAWAGLTAVDRERWLDWLERDVPEFYSGLLAAFLREHQPTAGEAGE